MKRILALTVIALYSVVAHAAEYKIDPDHSTVGFKVKHLTISTVPGRFTEFTGTFSYDAKNLEASNVEAKIVVKSINTEQAKRDDHLRGPEFFDVQKFPEITYKSTKVTSLGSGNFVVVGNLTMHGITQPVEIKVESGGEVKDPWGNERAGFVGTAKINRKDFGLTWNKTLDAGGLALGEEVQIVLEIEGVKQK